MCAKGCWNVGSALRYRLWVRERINTKGMDCAGIVKTVAGGAVFSEDRGDLGSDDGDDRKNGGDGGGKVGADGEGQGDGDGGRDDDAGAGGAGGFGGGV